MAGVAPVHEKPRFPRVRKCLEELKVLLAAPVSGASLAVCRMALGLVTVLEAYSLCTPSRIVSGKIPAENYFVGSDIHFHFPYAGFEWLPLLPAPWFYALIGLMAISGLSVALGLFYRVSATTAFLIVGYLFAVESTRTYYQSYYYIELLLTFLILWLPAARRYSLDAWFSRKRGCPRTVPFWPILLLRGQLLLMYFYGGVAKLNADWLLDAAPLRWSLREAHVGAGYERFLSAAQLALVKDLLHSVWLAYFLSYAGVLFDLSIGFLLLIRRTRILALLLLTLFHAINHFVIYDNIDWFPLVGVTTALIFLDPDWPERFWNWVRQPKWAAPDWKWMLGGVVLVPGVGAALGWKLKATPATGESGEERPTTRGPLVFVVAWLVWQTVMPLRHFFIPGDVRITYEGLSFSWRLKADEHDALAPRFFVRDPKLISPSVTNRAGFDWKEWHGDEVLYRQVNPSQLDWRQLPEIVTSLEPLVGERLLYNPYSDAAVSRTEAAARERISSLWKQLYGREPAAIRTTWPLAQVLQRLADALKAGGDSREASDLEWLASHLKVADASGTDRPESIALIRGQLLSLLRALRDRDSGGALLSQLCLTAPFAFEGQGSFPGPFLVIEDPFLVQIGEGPCFKLDTKLWKSDPATRNPGTPGGTASAAEPLVIYIGNIGSEAKFMLPQAFLVDSSATPRSRPLIVWNTLRDVNPSKLTHIANQPFYLRRYARRIAELWEKQYGRWPAVTALTAVSLNHRPFQPIVDPDTDLASVPVAWFRHNRWIRDLETPRIPAAALSGQSAR